ncbi:bifunctional lysylphosphatidylglycerol flippase/synthetase MprF [Aliihoeflea sp. PC F10.4]
MQDSDARTFPLTRLLEPRVAGPLIGALAVTIGFVVIHEISGRIHLSEVHAAFTATPWSAIVAAIALTMLSFAAMSLYDVLAARHVARGKVRPSLAALAGLIGYGFSNTLGFHVFIGGPVRYRIYQTAGLDAADVGRIVGISFLTFTGGLATIIGVSLLIDPAGIPALHAISPAADRALGAVTLVVVAAGIVWLRLGHKEVRLFGWRFPLPGAGSAIVQIIVGAVDIGAAAGVLYVLMPADIAPGYAAFLLIFVAAIIASVISHAPGGIGVLEATILLGLGAGMRPDVIAALLMFRIIYYFVPLGAAAVALAVFEALKARARLKPASAWAGAFARLVVPPAATALVFVGGLVLLVSGATPTLGERASALENILPLPFAEASHLLASLTGLLLIIVARGLFRRLALARLIAISLLLAGAVFSLLKGLDWEEAAILTVLAGLLYVNAPAFYRKGKWRAFRPTAGWIALIIIVLAAAAIIGLFAYRHVDYREALWWQFSWDGDAPRFLRASLALAIVAAAVAVDALINRPAQPKHELMPVPDAVRKILATSSGTQPNVALLGDKAFIVSSKENAFLMYSTYGRSWITMGDPVGDESAGQSLIWRFAEMADRAGGRAVFYAAQPQYLSTYLDLGLAIFKIGEIARVDLSAFSLEGAARQPFRYAANRAIREKIEFAVIPKAKLPVVMDELREVSDAWMEGKTGHEKSFSLGSFDEAYLGEFDCAVMCREGKIVAFANLWRSGDGEELSIDLMRYRPHVSHVLMDALFAQLMLYGKAENYRWFSLGAAPLAGLADHPLSSTWNRIGTFIYRRGDEFYNFEGLRAFKQKFDPVWTPQYIACRGGISLPQVLLDVTGLISGSPIGALRK